MRRLAPITLLLACAAAAAAEKPAAGILELTLPDTIEAPLWALDRVSKLEIDGKDYTTPRLTKRTVTVRPKPGAATVKVVYTFWPYAYSKTVRTRAVKVVPGETVKVSLLKEDPATPDRIFPIYVPTSQAVVDEMCKAARLTKGDVACDIGCGDGRLCVTAVKRFGCARAVGYDIDPSLVELCRKNAKEAGVGDRVTFEVKDALAIKDLSHVSVVFLYVGEDLGKALEPVLRKTLKPGARVVSHRFPVGGWKPDRTTTVDVKGALEGEVTLHVWEVKKPAGGK